MLLARPPGPIEHGEILIDSRRLFLSSQARPKRIEGSRIYVAGLFPSGEVVIEKHSFLRVPQVLVDRQAAGFGQFQPVLMLRLLANHVGKVSQVPFVVVEQAVQADGSVMLCGTAERIEAERNIETRLAHGTVALVKTRE